MQYDIVIVGAGFGGIYALHKAREAGLNAVVLEAGNGVGGTWFWNRYPGARCDVESSDYQFGFSDALQRGWTWTERYASQPEIRAYLEYVVDTLELRDGIQLNSRVTSARFSGGDWTLTTTEGHDVEARHCILATGPLSASRIPEIPGRETFAGAYFHTGNWPAQGVDFTDQRVGIVGTGSSGIQAIPIIAQQARELYVFQRTPNYSMPAFNRKLSADEVARTKDNLVEDRKKCMSTRGGSLLVRNEKSFAESTDQERIDELESRWGKGGFAMLGSFTDVMINPDANDYVGDFVRRKMADEVKDASTAAKLAPNGYPFLAKRPCLDTDYLATFNRPEVTLVDISSTPISGIVESGMQVGDDVYPLDVIVFATGFDAMTGAILNIDIVGRDGAELRDSWAAGPRTYLGLGAAGFPNLFFLVAPGSPSVLTNVVVAIEQQVDWIVQCLVDLRSRDANVIEVKSEAENRWVDHVNDLASNTLFMKAASWYLGANVPGKPRVFMPYVGGLDGYGAELQRVAGADYDGFSIS